MYFQIVVGTGSYTTSTTNMYNKHGFYLCGPVLLATPVPGACAIAASGVPVSQHLSRAPEKSTPSVSALHGTKALIKKIEDTEHDALT